MAVVQVTFRHHRVAWKTQRIFHPKQEAFSHQLRRLAQQDAREWSSTEDILIDWGDPACHLDPEILAKDCRNNAACAFFGRSWIHYHRPSHQITMAIDCLGLFPILLSQQGQNSYLASDALALSQLLDASAIVDTSALLELLAYGQLLGSQTTLSDALHLQAGTVYGIDADGRLTIKAEAAPVQFSPYKSNALSALQKLQDAVYQRLENCSTCAVSFDGTLEDYLLLALVKSVGGQPTILGFGPAYNPHLNQVHALAGLTNGKFYLNTLDTSQLVSARKAFAQLGGGEFQLTYNHLLIYPELITHTRGMTLLSHNSANILSGLPNRPPKTATQDPLKTLFNKTLQPFITAFPELSAALCTRLDMRLEPYRHGNATSTTQLNQVYLGECFRRAEVAREQLLSRDYARSYPFLDEPVLKALSGLPYELKQNSQFCHWAIRQLDPDIANLAAKATAATFAQGVYLKEPSEYTCWLNTFHHETQPLHLALQSCDLSESSIRQGLEYLLQGETRQHIFSTLGAYSGWLRYLAAQRAARIEA
ncbi:MAG: hypothetical protein AAF512_15545 [Pseudomonadota bacterium]